MGVPLRRLSQTNRLTMNTTSELAALHRIGLSPLVIQRWLDLGPRTGDHLMRLSAIERDHLELHDGQGLHTAQAWPALTVSLQTAGRALLVGDWVLVRPAAPSEGRWVMRVLAPLNHLTRREPSGRRQGLVSNVDTALLVMGCDRDFNLRRLDRMLALVEAAGVQAVVVLSKADACPDPWQRVALVQRHLGSHALPVLALDTRDATAAAQLAPWLGAGRTLVLLGASGAGKTSLRNTLCAVEEPEAPGRTGLVRASDDRGQHTTTRRTLHPCGGGACVIDTPGLRGLQLDGDAADLALAFDDVHRLAPACHFRNCQHQHEPGCAVREAVAPSRLQSWHKLHREAQRAGMDWLARRALQDQWRRRTRSARAAARAHPQAVAQLQSGEADLSPSLDAGPR
jgi:ribosome biogenesis GTPase / thiamine phosphate phosphatase